MIATQRLRAKSQEGTEVCWGQIGRKKQNAKKEKKPLDKAQGK